MAGFNVFRIFGFHIDFFTDRLFRIYSFLLFLILAVSLAWEFRYNGLHCFTPMHFSSRMAVYADIVCGQSSKLYESSLDKLPRHHEHESEIHRYFNMNKMRYLPVVLTGQSLLFLLPWLFWKLVSGGCCTLQGLVNDSAKMTTSNDPKTGRTITSELLKLQSSGTSIVFVLSYLLSKAMYWAICLFQMGILAKFLDINFFKYRYSTHMYDSYDVRTTGNDTESVFPRIVLCGFEVQRLGSFQRYTVECAVPLSEVMERYLYVIWAWIITLAVLMAINGILYFLKSIFWLIGPKSYKNSFIKRKLNDINQAQSVSQTVVDKFGDLYLKPGTFLAFEILEENGSLHAVSMAVNHMWEEFLKTAKLGDDVVEIPERTGPSYTYTPMVEMGSGDVQGGPTGAQSKPGPYHSVQGDLKNV